jgi:catalase-peroxidase
MLTSDLALRVDEAYEPIARRFHEHPDELAVAFAKAWYKLTHRDMGPLSRYLGPLVPAEPQLWQDPVPPVDHDLVDGDDIEALKTILLSCGPTPSELISTAWASASSFRTTDKRGGANGARIRLAPQRDWPINAGAGPVVAALEALQQEFNTRQSGGTRVSVADLIVLAGCAAVEAASDGGVTVAFRPGRTDATQDLTDVDSFAVLEPTADGFRNYVRQDEKLSPETLLLERAFMLDLTPPEMTVLVGGLRVLGANVDDSTLGVWTRRPGTLTTDFFVNALDADIEWRVSSEEEHVYEGLDRASDEVRWTGTAVDLVFASNSELRALSEVYAADDGQEKFVRDFAAAWSKVMHLDRFDLRRTSEPHRFADRGERKGHHV